jgi:type IV secretion system protein VirB4
MGPRAQLRAGGAAARESEAAMTEQREQRVREPARSVRWPRFVDQAVKEPALARFVPFSSLVSPHDVLTRTGDWMRIWRLGGIAFECADEQWVSERHEAKASLLRNLGGGQFALWEHRIRRRFRDELSAPPGGFSLTLDRAYKVRLAEKPFMSTELYLSVLYRPFQGLAKFRKVARSAEDVRRAHREARTVMEERTALVERTLREFEPELLGSCVRNGVEYSEVAEFLFFLVNGFWRPVRPPRGPLYRILPAARPFFGGDKLELRGGPERRFAALVDIKEYATEVEPGTFDPLLYEASEFVETMSYSMLPRRQAINALKTQRNQLVTSQDVVATQIEAMDQALNDVGDGAINMGEYHYSLMVFGESPEQAGKRAAQAMGAMAEQSAIEMVAVDLVADAAWIAQWPGNWRWRPREAKISSRAYAALAANHNFARGKRDRNPWGEAVAILRTPSGQPFYFNFHVSGDKSDDFDKKNAGNTMLIGTTGVGKTTTELFLVTLTQKFDPPPRLVVFDVDRGSEIAVRAMGGRYFALETGRPTGFNPLQRDMSRGRMPFLESWIQKLIESPVMPLKPSDERAISEALAAVAAMPPHLRRLTTVRQNLPNSGDNSLYERLGRWCRGGALGWVFDEADDRMGEVSKLHMVGFDYTDFLKIREIRTPMMMCLMDLMETMVDGRRLIYVISEFWKALDDPYFAGFARDKQKTIRKQSGLGIFDTQSPSDILDTENGRTLVEQSVTKICLPNPGAKEDEYVDGFGLSKAEYEIVKTLPVTARRFLVKQGHRSAVCELDLSGMDDAITILSGSTENVALLDEVRAQVGDDVSQWLPLFLKMVRERSSDRRSRVGSRAVIPA